MGDEGMREKQLQGVHVCSDYRVLKFVAGR